MKAIGAGAVIGGTGLGGVATAATDGWSMVALPDTQKYAASTSLLSYAQDQTTWIANNVDAENIVFVSHEGDLVDNGSSSTEWQRIDGVMDTLDGVVPYSAPPGDHDWAVEEDRSSSTDLYRQYFGASRYSGYSWFGGAAPNDLSHYQLFSAGGYDFLHIDLEWEAPGSVSDATTPLGWAQSVMDQYPERPTIITTHSYVWDGDAPGRTTFVEENSGNGSSGEEIWQAIVEPNPQVFMVLCGNFHEGSGSDNGEYHQVSTNVAGQEVYEMLANYQDYANGGDGWLRLIDFVPGGGSDGQDRIQVRTYSPSLDQFATDSSSQFGFDLDFASRFAPGDTATESLTFQQGTSGYGGTSDTYIQQASPSATNATAATLNVDEDDPNGTGQDVQALLRFAEVVGSGSSQVPPGATVVSARLTLETTNDGDGASLHPMLVDWSDTASWETFGGDGIQADGAEAASGADVTTGVVVEGSTTVDVTGSVQAWVDGQANYGWAFLPSGNNGWDFYSAEGSTPPALTVTYESGTGGGDTSVAVTTDSASDVTETTATLNGTLTDLGGASSADVAFEYRPVGETSWTATATQTLSSTGSYSTAVSGLTAGTDYEFRAVATASDGDTDAGTVLGFTTVSDASVAVTTDPPASVGDTTATLAGTLTDLGGASSAEVSFEYREAGTNTWTATASETHTTTGTFETQVTGLTSETGYEYRALASASDGDTDTGSVVSFTTTADLSVAVSTASPTEVGETSATLEGTLDDLGGADSAQVGFEYRLAGTSSWTATPTQSLSATGPFDESVTGLADGDTYEYRAVTTASDGDTATGSTVSFATTDALPAVTTGSASGVSETSATFDGTLDDLGNAASVDVGFEYRETGANSWSATATETLSATGPFSATVSDLAAGTEYEYRATAAASDGDSAAGTSQTVTTTAAPNSQPTIDRYEVTEQNSPNPHFVVTADWAVGDVDGDLELVTIEVIDASDTVVADSSTPVSGSSASGQTELMVKHVDGQTFTVRMVVRDQDQATATQSSTLSE